MPWAAMKRSSVSKRSRGVPSSSLTTPPEITSDGSGSPGPFIATRPSEGSGLISVSRRSGAAARTRKRSLRGSSLTSGVLSSPRSAITTAASRTKAAQRGAATAASCCAIASSSAAVARRGRSAV